MSEILIVEEVFVAFAVLTLISGGASEGLEVQGYWDLLTNPTRSIEVFPSN